MIRFDHVTKIYNQYKPDETKALHNVSFTVNKGELLVLKGASGSGKSTILSLLSVLTKPTEGAIFVGDQCISKLPDHFASRYRQNRIGIIFQQFNLILGLSIFDNIAASIVPLKNKRDSLSRVNTLLTSFGLIDKATKLVRYLSGGEQQRVAIIRALINNPDIILADEPTANLDAKLTNHFMETIQEIHKQGKTVIIATHDERFLSMKAKTRIIHIEYGRIS